MHFQVFLEYFKCFIVSAHSVFISVREHRSAFYNLHISTAAASHHGIATVIEKPGSLKRKETAGEKALR